ncbi:hypothetical protein ACN28E_53980 [Archangium lansingense]|uniref:hypothetical protein n=1 Tax=Archangium lansingense TaxID=2995310 RepID=UPI003B7B5679
MPTKSSRVTTDHEEIRQWAELRCGRPSMVTGTGEKDHAGILRIDFPGYSGRGTLEPITWDEFFEKFEESNLALVYSVHAHGHRSNFNKLVARESVDLETGEKVGPSRHRRKQAEQVAAKSSSTPRRKTRSTPAASGERRTPRSAAARTARTTKGRGSQRGGARQNPERRGSSRGGRSRSR